jgi:hypothetical protein
MPNKSPVSMSLALIALFAGCWVWLGLQNQAQVLGALGLASIVVIGAYWYRHASAQRRWRRAWEAYARRDLAFDASHKLPASLAAREGRGRFVAPMGHQESSRFRLKEEYSYAGSQS